MGIGGDVGPNSADRDRTALVDLRCEQLGAAVLEGADGGGVDCPRLTVDVGLAPLAGLGVIKKKGRPFPMALRAVGLNSLEPGAASPNGLRRLRAFHGHRVGSTSEGVEHSRDG